jgi:hypothetical protein
MRPAWHRVIGGLLAIAVATAGAVCACAVPAVVAVSVRGTMKPEHACCAGRHHHQAHASGDPSPQDHDSRPCPHCGGVSTATFFKPVDSLDLSPRHLVAVAPVAVSVLPAEWSSHVPLPVATSRSPAGGFLPVLHCALIL